MHKRCEKVSLSIYKYRTAAKSKKQLVCLENKTYTPDFVRKHQNSGIFETLLL
jgi:hypothetical protein